MKKPEKPVVKDFSSINLNKWSYFHRWYDKVKSGEIDNPLCPKDDSPLFPGINKDDNPLLRCLICNTKIELGKDFYERSDI